MAIDLLLNYSGMMEAVIGPHGVAEEQLKDVLPALETARTTLLGRFRGGDLEWMGLPLTEQYLDEVSGYWDKNRDRLDVLVVLGMGGSSLGSTALQTALRLPFWNELPAEQRNGVRLYVLDNIDPERLGVLLERLDLDRTLFSVITKSGSTAETLAQFMAVLPVLKDRLGERWKEHLVVTTDPEKGAVRQFAKEYDLPAFSVPPGVGGRYSVLSPVGLFSAVGTGVDAAGLLAGAKRMYEHFDGAELENCMPLFLGGLLYLAHTAKDKPIHVMMPYCDRLKDVADWYRQLWAESLGKAVNRQGQRVNTGPTPVKALGTTDQHSQMQLYMEGPFDKVIMLVEVEEPASRTAMGSEPLDAQAFTYLAGKPMWELLKAEALGTKIALLKAGRPSLSLHMPAVSEEHVGQFLYAWEVCVAVVGELYDVNAFDQPGVEAGKIAAYAIMGRKGFEEAAGEIAALKSKLDRYVVP